MFYQTKVFCADDEHSHEKKFTTEVEYLFLS